MKVCSMVCTRAFSGVLYCSALTVWGCGLADSIVKARGEASNEYDEGSGTSKHPCHDLTQRKGRESEICQSNRKNQLHMFWPRHVGSSSQQPYCHPAQQEGLWMLGIPMVEPATGPSCRMSARAVDTSGEL